MRVEAFARFLEAREYTPKASASRLTRARRVEKAFGDLDEHYNRDRLDSVVTSLAYSTEDEQFGKKPPKGITIDGNARKGLASLKNAVLVYRAFRDAA